MKICQREGCDNPVTGDLHSVHRKYEVECNEHIRQVKPRTRVCPVDFSYDAGCLFCGKLEKSYTPSKDVEFVCGTCVSLLASADQDDMKRAHGKAIATGYSDKAKAIESFIIPEVKEYDQKRPKTNSLSDGKRNVRVLRTKERCTQHPTAGKRFAIRQNQQNPESVL